MTNSQPTYVSQVFYRGHNSLKTAIQNTNFPLSQNLFLNQDFD